MAKLLGTAQQFWMRLQADWDMHQARPRTQRAAS
jgi:plasmid maintenance system antidote protein VapI